MSYEEERKTAIRDGFLEILRKELLDASLEEDVREQSIDIRSRKVSPGLPFLLSLPCPTFRRRSELTT